MFPTVSSFISAGIIMSSTSTSVLVRSLKISCRGF